MCLFPGAPTKKYQSGLKQQKVILSVKEAGSQVSMGLVPPQVLRGRVVVAVAILAFQLTSLTVSIFTQPSPCVSLCPHFPRLEDSSRWMRVHPNPI